MAAMPMAQDQLGQTACRMLGKGWTVCGTVYDSRRTRITRLENPNAGRQLVLKRYLTEKEDAAQEYSFLARISAIEQAPSVVSPVLLLADENAYCMDWLKGETLVSFCKTSPENHKAGYRAFGDWLAQYHRIDPPQQSPLQAERRLKTLSKKLAGAAPRADAIGRQRLEDGFTTLERVAAEIPHDAKIDLVHAPSDANPRNYMHHNGAITGFDLQPASPRPRLSSIAGFLVRLRVILTPEATSCACCGPDVWSFFRGYGMAPPAGPLWTFETLYAAIHLYASQLKMQHGPHRGESAALVDVMTRQAM